MEYSQGRTGRVFVVRLGDGDRLPDSVEAFAAEQNIHRAVCWLLGGAGGGRLVVGPRDASVLPPEVLLQPIEDAHEMAAVGTIFPDSQGRPKLHMHAALGREDRTRTGCVRPGVDVWLVGELVILELLDVAMSRKKDAASGLELLAGD
ncbi:PPC domain-containing DNA-binding protein [Desulfovibrio sp.]